MALNTTKKYSSLLVTLIFIGGAIYFLESQKVDVSSVEFLDAEITLGEHIAEREEIILEKQKTYEEAKEITSPDGFINTDSITIEELIGKKVILIDFWTYSCINCQRTLPYLNNWYETYRDQGLEIIGVHTPEFKFEEDYENVLKAVKKFNVKYPVVLDNDYSTWYSYKNQYWPRKYIIDIDGFIVYDHIGEGAYEETEKIIQELLGERNEILGVEKGIRNKISTPQDADKVDFSQVKSPEIYFGPWRNDSLANGTSRTDGVQELNIPEEIAKNSLYLDGVWEFGGQTAENKSSDSRIVFFYEARKVNFVASADTPIEITVILDDKFVKSETINEPGLYNLINNDTYGEHVLEIIIKEPGVRVFTFTFG